MIAALCLILVGGSFAAGTWYGLHTAATAFKISGAFMAGMAGLKADAAYRSANPAEAEAILLDHTRFLSDPSLQEYSAFGPETLAADRLLTFGRLAQLAANRGDSEAREQYLGQAKVACSAAGYQPCDPEFVLRYVERLRPAGD